MMPYSLAVKAMAGLLALSTSCGPDVTIVKNCAGNVIDMILVSNDYEVPNPNKPGGSGVIERYYCAVILEPGDPRTLEAHYTVQDPKARINPWGWWVACILNLPWDSRLPTSKSTGAANELGQEPEMFCHDATVPVAIIAEGTCKYDNPNGTNLAVFNKGRVAVTR